MLPCSECGEPVTSTDPRAFLCGQRCKARRHRRLHAAREDEARRLLMVMHQSILNGGDPAERDAIVEQVRRLVG